MDRFPFKPGYCADPMRDFRQGADLVEFKHGVAGFEALAIEQRCDDMLVTYSRGSILCEKQSTAAFGK